MPGFDRTGPRGMGPLTGGGWGYCQPRGIGRGRRGAFPGWGGYYRSVTYGAPPASSRETEMADLNDQLRSLRDELAGIEARIQQLNSQD